MHQDRPPRPRPRLSVAKAGMGQEAACQVLLPAERSPPGTRPPSQGALVEPQMGREAPRTAFIGWAKLFQQERCTGNDGPKVQAVLRTRALGQESSTGHLRRLDVTPPADTTVSHIGQASAQRCGAHSYPLPSKSTTDLPQALCSQSRLAKNPGSRYGKLFGPNPRWRKQLVLQLGPGGDDTGPGMWLSWAGSLRMSPPVGPPWRLLSSEL
ncbi:unnamed protein product [Rangifer tarandus platyrhynchus]|uniref:Uncharacterized protein n=2 Tax=Rangifer tarandus platyrhynchus TaxID=3082113 RepID=A0AC59YIF2_RANTA